MLGRDVTVEGTATARLLPFPSVTFTDVRVAGGDGQDTSMTIETFSMDMELAPFMRGEILIFDMRIDRPRGMVRVSADGEIDWAVHAAGPVSPSQVTLERLTVSEGQIVVSHGPSGRTHMLSELNAEISAQTLAGPWRLNGSLRVDGLKTEVAIATGRAEDDGMRMRLRAAPERYPVLIDADGRAGFDAGRARFGGTFRLDMRSSGRFESIDDAGRKSAQDMRLAGAFSLDPNGLEIPEFRLETGPLADPYTADGSAALDIGSAPRFRISATGAQMRLADEIAQGEGETGMTLAGRLDLVREVLRDAPMPSIPGTIELALPALVAGDTTIRDVKLSAEPGAGGWVVNALEATLPGRTTLEASGALQVEDEFRFRGDILLAISQPSGFAAWLARDVDEAIRRLPSAGFAAKVDLSEDSQSLSELELVLGAARFRGELDRQSPANARPNARLKLEGGELDLEGLHAFASLFLGESGASRFSDHDLDLDLDAGPVSIAGLVAEHVDAGLRLKDDRLDIDRLMIANLFGSDLSATGELRELGGRVAGNLDATILAADLGPLVDALVDRFPDSRPVKALASRRDAYPDLFEDVRLDLLASAARSGEDQTDIAVSAEGRAGTTSYALSGSVRDAKADLALSLISLELTGRSENAAEILAIYGLRPFDLGMLGPGEAQFTLSGIPRDGAGFSLEARSEDERFALQGSMRDDGVVVTAEGSGEISLADAEPWAATIGVPLPGIGYGLPAQARWTFRYGDERLDLSAIEGRIGEGSISGDLAFTTRENVPHATGRLDLAFLDTGRLLSSLFGEQAVTPVADSWSTVPFSPSAMLPVTGEIDLAADVVELGLEQTAGNLTARVRIEPEGVRIGNIAMEVLGGNAAGLVELRNSGGNGILSAQLALEGVDAGSVVGQDGLEGTADLSIDASASGKSVEAMMASLAGSGAVVVTDLEIEGLAEDAFPRLISAADEVGSDIGEDSVRQLAVPLVATGRLRAPEARFAFTLAGGILRTGQIPVEADGATLTAELRADAAARTIGAEATLAYDPGNEALVGSEPVVGVSFLRDRQGARLEIGTAPLAQFLTQRALEIEQMRVERLQAGLMEQQRLRRETRYYAALDAERRRLAEEEEARRQAEEEARRAAEEEARLRAEEEARAQREREAAEQAAAEEEARRIEEEQRAADEAARLEAERAEADRRAAESEALRRAAEQSAREQAAEQEALRRAEEERQAPAATAQPLPPPVQSQPSQRSGPRDPFDAPSIDNFLRSLSGRN